ncbi:aminopeptidase [Thermosulfidibacter takaii ABI70S6]|uniref:Aminopeptidase n=1 Tax=Thermosulfidibacter takaii (strain DSM 17441 / JCM 13301 / NBRC 103674 / ABI70S6) TaxID=1298851 RepID=A0A0S3QUG0_THET7|nr:aminopeptidase [Thermosulfidibacter takaii]BAT71968.1 aminopeptidase [Thermosulfidibacter takaii ABI70S6]
MDPRVRKWARLLVEYSIGVKEDEIVLIRGTVGTQPLVKACYEEVLKKGAHPIVRLSFEGQSYTFYKLASEKQLKFISEIDRVTARSINGLISIIGESNTKELTNVDHKKVAMARAAYREIRDILDERELKGEFRWVLTAYPTSGLAQDAEMSTEEFEEFVYEACGLNAEDPIAYWKEVAERQQRIADFLNGVKELRYVGPETDLTVKVEGRKWINCKGDRNMPDGEVFTSPIEDSAEGYIYFDFPAVYSGVEVIGVRLIFEKGRIVKATAEKGEEFLNKMLDTDEGARYLGEVAFGLNEGITRFTKDILFDEKIGGTIHMAAGASYPETGGKNKSGLHWDFIKSMKEGEVYADGKLIYKNGRFVFE